MTKVPEQIYDDGIKMPEQAEASDAKGGETAKESSEDETLLSDFSLERLLDTKSSAKLDIKSEDTELHPDRRSFGEVNLTPRLKTVSQKIEGEEIWKFIKSPSTDKRQILQRQKLLRIFIESGKIEQFIKLKNGIYGITNGTGQLMERYEISRHNQLPLLDAYRQHNRGEREVFQALASIEYGLRSMQELIAFLKSFNNPFLNKIAEDIQKKYEELSVYTREKILGKSFEVRALNAPNRISGRTGINLAVFMEMAHIAQTDKYAEATFDPTKKAEYKQGWNFLRTKEGGKRSRYDNEVAPPQVMNDSPKDTQTTIYTGSNMSGKSFELRKVLFMQFVAQAYGYAPCSEGNFAIYDSFHYLDRASTNSGANLSAFGSEIDNLKDSIARLGDHPFLCYDEGGSTTSAPDQYRILTAVDLFLRQKHARIFFANHNEQFVVRNTDDQNVGLYHLETTVDEEGKAKYHHLLAEGPADSMALEVARSLKFPEYLLAHARDYLEGRRTKVERVPKKPKKLKRYSAEEREALSAEKKDPQIVFKSDNIAFISYNSWGNNHLAFEGNKDGAFQSFSEDAQFRTTFFSGSPFCVGAKTTEDTDEEEDMAHEDFYEMKKIGPQGEEARLPFLLQFIKNCDNKDPREVLERQDLFRKLVERGEYGKAVKLEELIQILIYRLRESLPKITDGLLALNKAISPLDDRGYHWEHESERDIAKETITYIELQKTLFGNDFPFDAEYEELKKLTELAEKAEAITIDIDLDTIVKMENEDFLVQIKDPKILEKIAKMKTVEKDHRGFLKAPITMLGLRKYMDDTRSYRADKWSPEIKAIHEELTTFVQQIPTELFGDEIKSFKKRFNEIREIAGDEQESAKWKGTITMRRLKDLQKSLYKKKNTLNELVFMDAVNQINKLISDLTEGLLPINLKPVGIPRLTRGQIAHALSTKMRNLTIKCNELPAKSISDFTDKKAIDLLMSLVDMQKKPFAHGGTDRGHLHYTLMALFADCDAIPEWLNLLRSYDNTHFNQTAGYMEKHLGELLEGVADSTGETLRGRIEAGKDQSYMQFEGDMKDLEDALFRIKIKFPELFSPHRELKVAVAIDQELNDTKELKDDKVDDLQRFTKFVQEADIYLNGKGQYKFSGYTGRAHNIYVKNYETKGRLNELKKEFIEKEIDGTLDRERLSQIAAEARTLGVQAMEIVEKIGGKKGSETEDSIRKGDIAYLREILKNTFARLAAKAIYSPKKERAWSYDEDMDPKDQYTLEWRELLYSYGIVRVSAIFLMGDVIKRQNHAPVDFHEGGEMRMEEAWSLFKAEDAQVKSDVSFEEDESLKLFNGANMSGKTFFLKKLVTNVLWAMFTGHAPAKNAKMPIFDEVVYIDRVQAKSDNNLSAFGNEIGFWNRFFQVLEQDGNVMTVSGLDEIGSTTSPKYQSALTWAISLGLISKGSIAAIASHNHDAIDDLKETYPGIAMPYHFATHKETDDDGKTTFKMDYKLKAGHVDSQAIDVAESMELDPEIIKIARMIKLAHRVSRNTLD